MKKLFKKKFHLKRYLLILKHIHFRSLNFIPQVIIKFSIQSLSIQY